MIKLFAEIIHLISNYVLTLLFHESLFRLFQYSFYSSYSAYIALFEHFKNFTKIKNRRIRAAAGIEPATSRTRNENHTTRPRAQLVTILTIICLYERFAPQKLCQGA